MGRFRELGKSGAVVESSGDLRGRVCPKLSLMSAYSLSPALSFLVVRVWASGL